MAHAVIKSPGDLHPRAFCFSELEIIMGICITLNKGRVPVKVWTREIEHEALNQLINLSQLPIVHGHIAAMPDVHMGVGAAVGAVIPTRSAIIPAAVCGDIGWGMKAGRLSL